MRAILKSAFLALLQVSALPLNSIYTLRRRWFHDEHVVIIMYHKISELTQGLDAEWSVSPAMFARQMDFLAANDFNVIPLDTFFRCLETQTAAPRNAVVITFDDGYANVFEYAYPVLLRLGFPATIFQTVQFADKQQLFTWDKQAFGDQPRLLQHLRALSWDEIRVMCDSGLITMGSHTMTHPHLGRLSPDEIRFEVLESKRLLELHTGQQVRFFAFPGGIRRYGDISDSALDIVAASGYDLACTSAIGRNTLQQDRFSLKRIGIGRGDTIATFRGKLLGAYDWVHLAQGLFQRFFGSSY